MNRLLSKAKITESLKKGGKKKPINIEIIIEGGEDAITQYLALEAESAVEKALLELKESRETTQRTIAELQESKETTRKAKEYAEEMKEEAIKSQRIAAETREEAKAATLTTYEDIVVGYEDRADSYAKTPDQVVEYFEKQILGSDPKKSNAFYKAASKIIRKSGVSKSIAEEKPEFVRQYFKNPGQSAGAKYGNYKTKMHQALYNITKGGKTFEDTIEGVRIKIPHNNVNVYVTEPKK